MKFRMPVFVLVALAFIVPAKGAGVQDAAILRNVSVSCDAPANVHRGSQKGSGVLLYAEDGVATAVTNFHMLCLEGRVTVNGVRAKVDAVDLEDDLALLSFPFEQTLALPPIREAVVPSEEVILVGNPHAIPGIITPGKVLRVMNWEEQYGRPIFTIDNAAANGMSGGGIWNANGELVGIHEGTRRDQNGNILAVVNVPVSLVQKLLK